MPDDADDPAAPSEGTTPRREGVGRAAGRGMVWTMGSTLAIRVGSLVTQVVLGWLLSDDDFGVYGIALSVALVVQVLQDGGLRLLLIQEGDPAFGRHHRAAFWLSTIFALGGAAVLAAVAFPLAGLVGEPRLAPVLIVISLALLPQGVFVVNASRLQIDQRFDAMARIEIGSAAVRYPLTIALAVAGLGPLAFAVPVAAVGWFEAAAAWWRARIVSWRGGFERVLWLPLLRRSRWVLAHTMTTAVLRQSDYLALGLTAPTAVVGTYFFAYQLTFQFATLIQTNIRRVLLASLALNQHDQAWLRDAMLRSAGVMALATSLVLLPLVSVAADLEALLWRGRWTDAVPAIEILAALLPLSLVLLIPDYTMQATGRFKLATLTALIAHLPIPLTALLVGTVVTDPSQAWIVAAGVGGVTVAGSTVQCLVALRVLETPFRRFASIALPPVATGLVWAAVVAWLPLPGPAAVRLVAAGLLFMAPFGLLARFVFTDRLRGALEVLEGLPGIGQARRLLAL